jgi:hypothetical protein
MIFLFSCGVAYVPPPCELFSDLSLPYPHCCPQPRCPESNTTEIIENDNSTEADRSTDHRSSESTDVSSNDISRQKINDETLVQYDVTLDDAKTDFEEVRIILNQIFILFSMKYYIE